MAEYYTIKGVKKGEVWHNDFGEFQGYSLSLEGSGEPVSLNKKVPVQHDPAPGDKLYGTVEMLMSKNGKTYSKFKTEKEPEDTYTAPSPQTRSDGSYEGHSDKEDSIARAVALKAAVETGSDDILALAEVYLAWLKNDSGAQPVETQGTRAPGVQREAASAAPAAVPKRQWNKVGQGEPLPEPPEDIADLNPGDYYDED